jgi:aerobic C4-dicarboxylate transport protein
MASTSAAPEKTGKKKMDRSHWLYILVIVAVAAGIAVGLMHSNLSAPDLWPSSK